MIESRQVEARVLVPKHGEVTVVRGKTRVRVKRGDEPDQGVRLPPPPGNPGETEVVFLKVHFGADAESLKDTTSEQLITTPGTVVDFGNYEQEVQTAAQSGERLDIHVTGPGE